MDSIDIARRLAREVGRLKFRRPVAHVYNPLDYAFGAYAQYLKEFGGRPKEALFVGMNPGPWGMAQTGIPFGEVAAVRDWLGIRGGIRPPARQHPRRPILGLDCPRSEVSGRRIWGWAQDSFTTPGNFFRRFLILNYCPLCFMEATGRNITPDKLSPADRAALLPLCDVALRDTVAYYRPRYLVAVGGFVEVRAQQALDDLPVRIGRILHPSPASPAANRGWAQQATAQLRSMGIAML